MACPNKIAGYYKGDQSIFFFNDKFEAMLFSRFSGPVYFIPLCHLPTHSLCSLSITLFHLHSFLVTFALAVSFFFFFFLSSFFLSLFPIESPFHSLTHFAFTLINSLPLPPFLSSWASLTNETTPLHAIRNLQLR